MTFYVKENIFNKMEMKIKINNKNGWARGVLSNQEVDVSKKMRPICAEPTLPNNKKQSWKKYGKCKRQRVEARTHDL